MKSKQYNRLVNLCIWLLRIAMLVLAVAIPLSVTVNSYILNDMLSAQILHPAVYIVYETAYSEVVLGYFLCMFLNFREKAIFVEENARYLKRIGYLIILKDFLYIPVDILFNQSFTIPFNFMTWAFGFIMVLCSKLILRGIKVAREQQYTV